MGVLLGRNWIVMYHYSNETVNRYFGNYWLAGNNFSALFRICSRSRLIGSYKMYGKQSFLLAIAVFIRPEQSKVDNMI